MVDSDKLSAKAMPLRLLASFPKHFGNQDFVTVSFWRIIENLVVINFFSPHCFSKQWKITKQKLHDVHCCMVHCKFPTPMTRQKRLRSSSGPYSRLVFKFAQPKKTMSAAYCWWLMSEDVIYSQIFAMGNIFFFLGRRTKELLILGISWTWSLESLWSQADWNGFSLCWGSKNDDIIIYIYKHRSIGMIHF